MKKTTNYLIWIFPILSIILLAFTMPVGESYYLFKPSFLMFLSTMAMYSFPVLIIIPTLMISSLLATVFFKNLKFIKRVILLNRRLFFTISVFIFIMNSGLAISKFVLGKDPFPRIKYADLTATSEDLSLIKKGKFKTEYGKVVRKGTMHRIEYEYEKEREFYITWLGNGEYQLINTDQDNPLNDTLTVLVTSIHEDYYECYYKCGEYALFEKIEIIK